MKIVVVALFSGHGKKQEIEIEARTLISSKQPIIFDESGNGGTLIEVTDLGGCDSNGPLRKKR